MQNALARNLRKIPAHWNFNSLTAKSNYLTCQSGWKRVVKEMMTGSLYRFPFSQPANFLRASRFRVFPTLSRLPHYRRTWNRLLSASLQSMASARTIFYKTFIVHTRIAALHVATVKLRDMMLFKNIRHYLFTRFLKQCCNEKVSIISQSYSLLLT